MPSSISIAIAALAAGAATAMPTALLKRQYSQQDVDILNYALTLEHLEDRFYREALTNYTQADFVAAGFPDPFYSNLKSVSAEETTHVAFLTSALQAAKAPAVAECTYAFPATDPKSFVALSSVVEGVGVSAYLGAAMDIMSPAYLTAAAQIAPVEARHTAYIRKQLGEAGMPQPFDAPLDLNEVYTLVAPFIVSCPSTNPTLPVKAFPSVALATAGIIHTGDKITLTTAAKGAAYAAFAAVTGPTFVPVTPVSGGYTLVVPTGFKGQSYVVLTSSNAALTDAATVAGPAIVEIEGVM